MSHANPYMRFGLSDPQYKLLSKLVIDPLKTAGARVWIFGSRARGDHRLVSDVDLLYDFPGPNLIPKGLIFNVTSDLEESRFPYTLDLVRVSDLAHSYKENILRERIEI
jgi:predicted nucleotidyltransferase